MPMLLRRQLARVMLFALVVAALAPGVSRALAFAQVSLAPWSVVCSVPAGASNAPAHEGVHLIEHCAWCSLHADPLAPPPTGSSALRSPALHHAVPALALHAPRPLPAWATAQARAPPASA